MTWMLDLDELPDLSRGATLLGTGGGGDPYIGQLMLQEAIRAHGPVTIVELAELDDDAVVIPTSMMGAPTVMTEKVPAGSEPIIALRTLERYLDVRATHTMPVECGGINSMIPLVVGARLGLPVVDGDGMGRAFPELQMETFSIHGHHGSPMALASERGETAIIDTADDDARMEWLARAVTIRLGGSSMLASYSMSGADVKGSAVPRTLTVALQLGRALRRAREQHLDALDALVEALVDTPYRTAHRLLRGKVVDVERTVTDGFTVGTARLRGEDGDLSIRFQNENLIAVSANGTRAIVPDLICVIEAETYEPITSERLRYGQRVQVIAIGTPQIMRQPAALDVFGPQAFGLVEEYVPVENLAMSAAPPGLPTDPSDRRRHA
jgi:DUF917 family protein